MQEAREKERLCEQKLHALHKKRQFEIRLSRSAATLQAHVRGRLARIHHGRRKCAIICLQSRVRGYLGRHQNHARSMVCIQETIAADRMKEELEVTRRMLTQERLKAHARIAEVIKGEGEKIRHAQNLTRARLKAFRESFKGESRKTRTTLAFHRATHISAMKLAEEEASTRHAREIHQMQKTAEEAKLRADNDLKTLRAKLASANALLAQRGVEIGSMQTTLEELNGAATQPLFRPPLLPPPTSLALHAMGDIEGPPLYRSVAACAERAKRSAPDELHFTTSQRRCAEGRPARVQKTQCFFTLTEITQTSRD